MWASHVLPEVLQRLIELLGNLDLPPGRSEAPPWPLLAGSTPQERLDLLLEMVKQYREGIGETGEQVEEQSRWWRDVVVRGQCTLVP